MPIVPNFVERILFFGLMSPATPLVAAKAA